MMALSANSVDFGEQNVIYITEQAASEWTIDATRELIRLYDEKTDLLEKGIIKTRKILFETIASEMVKKNFFYNPQQCENKWKSLKRSYLTRLERNPSIIKTKPKPFESEVAEIVKRERSVYRKSQNFMDPLYDDDYNRPPKIAKQEVTSDDSDNDSPKSNRNDNSNSPTKDDHCTILQNPPTFVVTSEQKDMSKDLLNEVRELKNVVKEMEQSLTKHTTQLQLLEEQKLQLKKTKMDKQNEIIQQMKIQNSLLAKIVQKLGP